MTINLKQLIADREAHDTKDWRFASPQRMARLPDLEEAFLEVVGLMYSLTLGVNGDKIGQIEQFLERIDNHDQVARAIYLDMHGDKGGKWEWVNQILDRA